jgi:O-antigen/teichoic acid export membrane protein
MSWNKSIQKVTIFLLRPSDTSTEEGRSNERLRRVGLTATASLAAKAISIIAGLITVPLTVGYLGAERYGIWMTISSIIALLAFADLGLGNGLLNAISEAHGRDDREKAKEYVSSALVLLTIIAAFILLAFSISYPAINWQRIFNISSPIALKEAGPAMFVFIACFAVNMPLGTIQRVQLGYQEGFANSIWMALGSLLSLMGILLAISLKVGLPWLVFAMAGLPALSTLLNGMVLFGIKKPWLTPAISAVKRQAGKKIIRTGFLFFVLQLAVALAYSSDNIVITQILGPAAVTQYAVPMKLFTITPLLIMMALNPLWPAYGEALVRKDYKWIKKTLSRSLLIVIIITSAAAFFLVVFGDAIIHLWVGPSITPSFWLLLGLGIWMVMGTVGNSMAMFLNGANIVGFQVITSIILAVGALILKVVLVGAIGIPGVIWATIIVYSLVVLLPYAYIIPRILMEAEEQ